MTARGFDYYDQMTAAAVLPTPTPTAPPQVPTAPQGATRRSSDRLMRGGAYLLTLAGVLLLAALLAALLVASVVVALTPLGRIDADITVPFVAVLVAALGVIAWRVRK